MKKTFPIKVYDLSITTVTLYELGLMDSGVLRVKAGRKQSGFCLMKDSITPVFYDVSRFARPIKTIRQQPFSDSSIYQRSLMIAQLRHYHPQILGLCSQYTISTCGCGYHYAVFTGDRDGCG